jgi:hypothetical protein
MDDTSAIYLSIYLKHFYVYLIFNYQINKNQQKLLLCDIVACAVASDPIWSELFGLIGSDLSAV